MIFISALFVIVLFHVALSQDAVAGVKEIAAPGRPLRMFSFSRLRCNRNVRQCQSDVGGALPFEDWLSQVQGGSEGATRLRETIADAQQVDLTAILAEPQGSVPKIRSLLKQTSQARNATDDLGAIVQVFENMITALDEFCDGSGILACAAAYSLFGALVVFTFPIWITVVFYFSVGFILAFLISLLTEERPALRLFFDSDCVGQYVQCEFARLMKTIMPGLIESVNAGDV